MVRRSSHALVGASAENPAGSLLVAHPLGMLSQKRQMGSKLPRSILGPGHRDGASSTEPSGLTFRLAAHAAIIAGSASGVKWRIDVSRETAIRDVTIALRTPDHHVSRETHEGLGQKSGRFTGTPTLLGNRSGQGLSSCISA